MLWSELRGCKLGVKFRRQHPLGAGYIADFYAHVAALVVEVDGGVHQRPLAAASDALRDRVLEAHGLRVLRVPAWRVERDLAGVVALVRAALVG
jgi:very-short-patch-repair endonuclease